MASFIAKQMLGNQLDSVKGAMGNKEEEKEGEEKKEIDPEVEQALREAEERRQEKHRKQEEERENMRQGIRDKYGLKKKEDPMLAENAMMGGDEDGRLGRKRKTPAELAAEAAAAEEEDDSLMGFLPQNVRDMASKVTEGPAKVLTEAQEKCLVM